MVEVTDILFRLRIHFLVKTNIALAHKIGINIGAINNWVIRKNIPQKRLLDIANKEGISLEWLISGTGNKELQFLGSGSDEILDKAASSTKVEFPSFTPVTSSAFWFQKKDNNMSPTIEAGEYVIVDSISELKDGGIYCIEAAEEKYILRFCMEDDGRSFFAPDISNMSDKILFTKQVKLIGQVVYILKNIK